MPPESQTRVTPSPTDAITRVAFSTPSTYLLISSWSGTLSLHTTKNFDQTAETTFPHALLDASFHRKSPSQIAAVSLSGTVLHTVLSQSALPALSPLGKHTAAASKLCFLADDRLATGGWDSTIRLWDVRSRGETACHSTRGKVYGLCQCGPNNLAIITSENRLLILDGRNPGTPLHDRAPRALQYQLRGVSARADGKQVAVGGTDGRVAVEVLEGEGESFSFRCHRGEGLAFPVHCVTYCGEGARFATGGGDGCVAFWDAGTRKRVAQFGPFATSVASLDFDDACEMVAVAVSYCFEEGEKDHPPDDVFIRAVGEEQVGTKLPKAEDKAP